MSALLCYVAYQHVGNSHTRIRSFFFFTHDGDLVMWGVLANRLCGNHACRACANNHMFFDLLHLNIS